MKKYFLFLTIFLITGISFAQDESYIVIDPMHGGKDTGATVKIKHKGKSISVYEKDIALKISKEVYKRLEEETGISQIFLTRDKDVFCSKTERQKKIRKGYCGSPAVYVSIGVNISKDKSKNGFMVYIPTVDPSNFSLANAISNGLEEEIGNKMQNLGLTYKSHASNCLSAVVIELGYLSNDKDLELLSQDEFIKKCANGIFEGINYFINYKARTRGWM